MPVVEPLSPVRVLVTGAGGPAAIAVLRALAPDATVTLLAADMDPWAAGLFLVPAPERVLVPAGDAPEFVDALLAACRARQVGLVVPTVDAELVPLARRVDEFERAGIRLLASAEALEMTLDKLLLARACHHLVRVPRTELADSTDPASWSYPVIVKPRRGSGSRGVALVASAEQLSALLPAPDLLVQEHLPGQEYSVDVLADHQGVVHAAVPRVRQRVDSGVSVAGYTLNDPELEQFARRVVEALDLPYVANVQIRRDAEGRPALLEVNPRVPGTLALTVAAGVDMARLAVDACRGAVLPAQLAHRPVALVRYLEDHVVELDDLPAEVGPLPGTAGRLSELAPA